MKVIEILMQEHQLILAKLDEFQALSKTEIADAPERVANYVAFAQNYADEYHHAKEEDILFQWMVDKNPGFQHGPIAVMLSDHDAGRTLIDRISVLLRAIETTPSSDNKGPLVDEAHQHIETFCVLLRGHIHKEDNVLYRFAEDIDAQTQDGDALMLDRFNEVNQRLAASIQAFE